MATTDTPETKKIPITDATQAADSAGEVKNDIKQTHGAPIESKPKKDTQKPPAQDAVKKSIPEGNSKKSGNQSLLQIIAHAPKLLLKKPLYILATALIFIVLILLSVLAIRPKKQITLPTPTQAPTLVTASPSAQKVSQSGNTQEFQNLEEELTEIQEEINNLDLLESRLTLPIVELNLGL